MTVICNGIKILNFLIHIICQRLLLFPLNFIFISIFRVDEMKRKKVLTCHATELSISNILHKRIASCLYSLEKIRIFPSQFPGIWRCPVLFLLEAFNKFLVESDCLTHVTLTMILSASATTQSVPFSH